MQREAKIINGINEVLPLVRNSPISADLRKRIISVEDLLKANEYGIAFEILCENLYEFSCPISKITHEKIEAIGVELKADKNLWLRLIPLITDLH